MVFERLGAYDCSTNFALRALSTCLCVKLHLLRADLENSNIGSEKQKPSPFKKETRRGIKQSCLFTTQSNTKASPFPSLRVHSKHEGANMKCKPNCAPGGTLRKTRLASCSGGILAGSTGEYWRAAPARYWPDTRQDPPARDTQRDTRRDPLAGCSGGILGGIHWRAALAGCSAGSTGEPLWWILGGIHWRAALARYWAGSAGQLLWRDTRRDPLASCSGGILGGIHWRAALAGYSAGSTGEPLWRDTRRDPLASSSGGILAGSTGEQLWRDTRRDPLVSCSGGVLGGIHWRAALTGWVHGVEASQTRIPT